MWVWHATICTALCGNWTALKYFLTLSRSCCCCCCCCLLLLLPLLALIYELCLPHTHNKHTPCLCLWCVCVCSVCVHALAVDHLICGWRIFQLTVHLPAALAATIYDWQGVTPSPTPLLLVVAFLISIYKWFFLCACVCGGWLWLGSFGVQVLTG